MQPARFNIRVYGIWIEADRLLVSEETIRGKQYVKLPGGGLELGEGIIDGLKREWREELDMHIHVLEHFYTTDFYQASAFDNSQVISIYYKVRPLHAGPYIINNRTGEHNYWVKTEDITEETFTLPIDKVVGKMLMQQ